MKKRIPVVAAIIQRDDGSFLLARRQLSKHRGGEWELPGGKIESHETESEALKREIKEELNLDLQIVGHFGNYSYDYPEIEIDLRVWIANCRSFDALQLNEHEEIGFFSTAASTSALLICPADRQPVNDWLKKKGA